MMLLPMKLVDDQAVMSVVIPRRALLFLVAKATTFQKYLLNYDY